MKKYEIVFILEEQRLEDQGEAFAAEFESFVKSNGGTIVESLPMGRKQFAREISRRKAGIYWDFIFSLDENKVKIIPDKFHLDERVLRLQIYKHDEKHPTQDKNIC